MPDHAAQFNSVYQNYFMMLFDDIFSTHEEKLIPLSSIKKCRNMQQRKAKRLELADALKSKDIEKTAKKLNEERAKTQICQYVRMAELIFKKDLTGLDEKEIEKLQLQERVSKAHFPQHIEIPNYNLKRTMYEWGMGGPTSKQYTLLAHVIHVPRSNAVNFYLGMISAYISFRENFDYFVGDDDRRLLSLKNFVFNKVEENIVVDLFLPKAPVDPDVDEANYADGPSMGAVFLELNSLTKYNDVFQAFVDKTMLLDSKVRERLASKYLYDRMIELSRQFVEKREMKYNYIRVAWERKFNFMDDYIICLILFIRDKVSNITWDEVEEVLYPKAKQVLRACYEVSRKAAIQQFESSFDTPPEYFC